MTPTAGTPSCRARSTVCKTLEEDRAILVTASSGTTNRLDSAADIQAAGQQCQQLAPAGL
ncbi:hypothetical protein AB0L10_44710 [Streptomyces flaveolus]|uniref:hypothetical protein n=1 Tax=Streptomyces flaveolus TaxID=67297 RepID=UPI003447F621